MISPNFLTQKMLISWGGEEVYAQACRLVKRGFVLKSDLRGDLLEGIVAREGATEIRTRLRIKEDGSIESLCPCVTNQRDGQVCPHVVALGVAILLRHSDPLREQKYQEEQRRARRMENISSSAYIQRNRFGISVRIGLSLSASWQKDFYEAGKIAIGLFLIPQQRPQAGMPPFFTPESLPSTQRICLTEGDENLLSVLEDICEGPPRGQFNVSPADFLNILRVATSAQIVAGGKNALRVEERNVPVALQVDLDQETGELYIYPKADIPDAREGALPVFLVNGKQGVAVNEGRIWPLRNVLPVPYHSIYRKDEIIPRDHVINFLERDLPNLRNLTPVLLQHEPDLFEKTPATPRFSLEIQGTMASLRGTLRARYGEHIVLAGIPDSAEAFAVPDPEDLLRYRVRNYDAERAALKILHESGFREQEGMSVIVGTREVLNFFGSAMPDLGRRGWKIVLSPKLEHLLDTMPVVTPVVKIDEQNRGWFDIGFTFDLPGKGSLPPAEVQRAIQRGDAFIQSVGKTVLLDKDAIESMRSIFNDCNSRESPRPGHFLLPQVYAPFVQASLHGMDGVDVEEPPDWRENASRKNRDKSTRFEPVPLGDGLEGILRPYQKQGVYWLRFLENSGLNGLLADEMGLGKTLQTLTWLSLSRTDEKAKGKPAIIVCPTSLVANWAHEAETFVPRLRRLVINGPHREGLFSKIPESDLIITSYALVRRDMAMYEPYFFSAAVLDEAQHIKNRTTQNAIAVKQLNAHNKLVLTGTPIENGVQDIWSIMDFLMPEYLGTYETFHENYEVPLGESPCEASPVQEKLRRKLHPFILRRIKKDVAKDLPDKIVKVQYCPMTPDQDRVYNEVLSASRQRIRDMVKEKGFDKSRFEILALLLRLRQICCHLSLLKDRTARPGEHPSAKMDSFFELLDEAMDGGHRILVFSQFVRMLSLVRNELEARGIPYCYLDGTTQDRLEQCQRFNRTPSIPVFLISLKAGGTGLNLTGADMVVHFDPWWNPAVEDQATDRAHRIGQKRTVYSVKLITEHSVEERVLAMQQRKQAIISATIGTSDNAIMSKLTFDDLRDIIGL